MNKITGLLIISFCFKLSVQEINAQEKGLVKNGTDQNQDRIPFRQQTKAAGHAVRANYA
jgi:DUF1680 family protein